MLNERLLLCVLVCIGVACTSPRRQHDLDQIRFYLENPRIQMEFRLWVDDQQGIADWSSSARDTVSHQAYTAPGITYLDGELITYQYPAMVSSFQRKPSQLRGDRECLVLFPSDEQFDWNLKRPLSPRVDTLRLLFHVDSFAIQVEKITPSAIFFAADRPIADGAYYMEIRCLQETDSLPQLKRIEDTVAVKDSRWQLALQGLDPHYSTYEFHFRLHQKTPLRWKGRAIGQLLYDYLPKAVTLYRGPGGVLSVP